MTEASRIPINWHYRRNDLAEQFLDTFEIGAVTALTLFAPRRMGKTEFAQQDLIPMAKELGYTTIYINFWDRVDDPVNCVIQGLNAASPQLSVSRKSKAWLQRIKSLGVNSPYGGVKLELSESQNQRHERSVGLDLIQDGLLGYLSAGKKLMLVLDEVQHLATRPEFEPLVFALRGLIDSHRQQMRVVYTGSSRNGLNQLFKRRNAPLFSSAQQIDLPELGSAYLEHISKAFEQASSRSLRLPECRQAFKTLKKVPYDYQQVISILLARGGIDIVAEAEAYLEKKDGAADHEELWKDLKPIDQAVLRCITADAISGLYTTDARAYIADLVGVEIVSVATVQNAVNRLKGQNIIAGIGQGRYEFEDPYLLDWIDQKP